jgi:hypothetical protein
MAALLTALALLFFAACGESNAACDTAQNDDGSLDLKLGTICLRGVTPRALVDGQWRGPADGVEAAFDTLEDGSVTITVSVEGDAQAFELALVDLDVDRMLQQGYMSWSFSGVIRPAASVPLAEDGAPEFKAATTGDVTHEERGTSYGSAVLSNERGPYLVIGAASAERATTGIALWSKDGDTRGSVLYGATRETLRADSSGISRSEPLVFIGDADVNAGLDRLREQIQAHLPADARKAKKPPGGWFSWNERFAEVDRAYLSTHVDLVRDTLLPLGMPLVELDDGWMPKWGDWSENDGFSEGLDSLAAEITGEGLVAGVWTAPFLVDVDSSAASTLDPSFFVRDAEGNPIEHAYTAAPTSYYVLDGSNPAAMAHVTDVVKSLADAGYTFFKFDFIYAGAIPGKRLEEVTGTEAFRSGMKLLLEAAGPDAIINACGVPIHPILGLTDSLRIGPDTAFDGFELAVPLLTSAARSYAARSYLFPLVWPDSDQTQVREPYGENLARMSAAVAAMAGPAYALGDDLSTLPQDRLGLMLDGTILDIAAAETPARPLDLMMESSIDVIPSPSLETAITPTYTRSPPPTRFIVTGKSGTEYELSFEWFEPYGVTIEERQ